MSGKGFGALVVSVLAILVLPGADACNARLVAESLQRDYPLDPSQAITLVTQNNAEEQVTWVTSYVTPDNEHTFCVYDAPSPEAIRRAAVQTYGDTIHSFLSYKNYEGPFLPGYTPAEIEGTPAGIAAVDVAGPGFLNVRVAADDCHLPYNGPEEDAIIPSPANSDGVRQAVPTRVRAPVSSS